MSDFWLLWCLTAFICWLVTMGLHLHKGRSIGEFAFALTILNGFLVLGFAAPLLLFIVWFFDRRGS